jgi:hypothetical protein
MTFSGSAIWNLTNSSRCKPNPEEPSPAKVADAHRQPQCHHAIHSTYRFPISVD